MGISVSKVVSTTTAGGGVTVSFDWTVADFQKLSSHGVGYCTTKDISATGTDKYSFSLLLYPNGFNERTEKYLSLWLKKTSEKELEIKFTCAIVDVKEKELCRKSVKRHLALESVLGWTTFCNRHFILDEGNQALNEGSLTFKCKIEILGSDTFPNADIDDDVLRYKSMDELSGNFQQLLDKKSFSDFSLKVGGETLHVHKAVLSARSPVFKAMFESPLHKGIKQIEIDDVVFEGMEIIVKYMYTGKIVFLTVPIAMQVYYAADKYDVTRLREICSKMLLNNLDLDNVIDVLLFAYRHCDFTLQETCLCFMDKNLHEIKGRPEWIDLMRNHPDLADKALFFTRTET